MVPGSAPLPLGFPLEQLSVSVSLGKPQQPGANEASVLEEALRVIHQSDFSYWLCALPGFTVL